MSAIIKNVNCFTVHFTGFIYATAVATVSIPTLVLHEEKAQKMSFETLYLSRVGTWEGLQALGSHISQRSHFC